MKRYIRYLYLVALACVAFMSSGCNSSREPAFGDGTYEIGIVDDGVGRHYALFDGSSGSVATNVTNWFQKGRFAYVIGEEGMQIQVFKRGEQEIIKKYPLQFFLINLRSNKLKIYKKLSEVPEQHRAIFKDLLKTKRVA